LHLSHSFASLTLICIWKDSCASNQTHDSFAEVTWLFHRWSAREPCIFRLYVSRKYKYKKCISTQI